MAAGEAYICGGRQSFNREKNNGNLFVYRVGVYLPSDGVYPFQAGAEADLDGGVYSGVCDYLRRHFFIKSYAGETLMRVGELNWYYILYVFGSISIILGVINLWMYKRGIIRLFTEDGDDDEEDDTAEKGRK